MMVEVGRHLWSSPGLTTLPKAGSARQVAQDHVQLDFEYLQEQRLHSLWSTCASA